MNEEKLLKIQIITCYYSHFEKTKFTHVQDRVELVILSTLSKQSRCRMRL